MMIEHALRLVGRRAHIAAAVTLVSQGASAPGRCDALAQDIIAWVAAAEYGNEAELRLLVVEGMAAAHAPSDLLANCEAALAMALEQPAPPGAPAPAPIVSAGPVSVIPLAAPPQPGEMVMGYPQGVELRGGGAMLLPAGAAADDVAT